MSEYLARKEEFGSLGQTPHRDTLLHDEAAKYGVTYRMVVRCLDEFLGQTEQNETICGYAKGGDGIQLLPADEKEIKKQKSGIYADKKVRLIG